MNKTIAMLIVTTLMLFTVSVSVYADDIFRIRVFFGLSTPDGGAVSLYDWQQFEKKYIAKTFEGFNVVDSTGFYKGKPERSKIVTLIGKQAELKKAKELAKSYAQQFHQESVMVVVVPVLEWSFVEAGN